jgi:predicted RNA-binding protein with PIN domain
MGARRELLIDAYNVLYAEPRFNVLMRRDVEQARAEFVAWVAVRAPATGAAVYVVFDAMRDPPPVTQVGRVTPVTLQRGIHVVYARESADTWIRTRMRTHAEPALLTVVTSDREILATAQAFGCGIQRVSEFLQLGAKQKRQVRDLRQSEKPAHQSKRELEEWTRLFEEPRDEE